MELMRHLKEMLKDILPLQVNTIKPPEGEIAILDYHNNPLNPHLLGYCFDNILGIEVHYRIYEKVNYVIEFDYKGTYGYVTHRKMSYNLYINKKYEKELLNLFYEIKPVLGEIFMEYGKQSLENNNFTMVNESYQYNEKLNFYCNRIEEIEKLRKSLDADISRDLLSYYSNMSREKIMEQKYAIESYIDTFFSFLEHVLTLLYPFTPHFNMQKSYGIHFIHNLRWTWDKKLKDVANDNEILNGYVDKLREIKEVYRNRNAHGMFSRELEVYVQVEKFGRYPMYLGKNYLLGFIDDFQISISYEKFMEIREVFESLIHELRQVYEVPMTFIEGCTSIPVEVVLLTKGVDTKEKAKQLVDKYHYRMDNQSNMDW